MPTEQGFSNQKKKGKAQFKTVHNVGSDAFGTTSISKSLYDISISDESVVSVTDVFGADGQVSFWNLEVFSHGASVGNIFRITESDYIKNFEFEIVGVVDLDNILVLPVSSIKPIAGNAGRVMGWVTNKVDEDGNPVVSQGPVQFKLNNVNTEVSKDSAVPANTIALPVEDFAARASLTTLAAKDFATQTTLASLLAKTSGAIVPVSYDQVVQTYVGATTDLSTVVFKAGGVTVATLTFTYDGSNRLINVART
jgi:hypothetical protein